MTSQPRIDWLKGRQTGIGGSEIAAIVGLNAWRTPTQVWESKVNPVEEDTTLIVQADDLLIDDLEQIQGIKAQVKELEAQEDAIKARVLMALQEAETLTYQGVKVATCKTQTRTSFDAKTFEKDYPELYAQYKKQSSTRVLRII